MPGHLIKHLFSRDRNPWECQIQRGRRASGERFRAAPLKGLTPDAPKPIKTSFSLTTKVSHKCLMIRNPKDFGVWSACPSGVHSVITELEMLPASYSPIFWNCLAKSSAQSYHGAGQAVWWSPEGDIPTEMKTLLYRGKVSWRTFRIIGTRL